MDKRILLPLKLSDGSRAALAVGMNLAQRSDATLVLLHVVNLNIAGEELGIPRTCLVSELRRDAEQRLRHLAETVPAQVPTEILVCEGKPAQAIVEMAARLAVGAIVMCSHVYRGWRKWLHRNTALHVLKDAPCPVYCVLPNPGSVRQGLRRRGGQERDGQHGPNLPPGCRPAFGCEPGQNPRHYPAAS